MFPPLNLFEKKMLTQLLNNIKTSNKTELNNNLYYVSLCFFILQPSNDIA